VLNSGETPDLIVMGGGAWDRLHVYATDEDRQSHATTLKDLAHEMLKSQKLGVPVVWTIPTTINSQALNTEGTCFRLIHFIHCTSVFTSMFM
jgi:hypothetical protein